MKKNTPRPRNAKGQFIKTGSKPTKQTQQRQKSAPRQKDPAKVKAGKIRAEKALRDSAGKLVSNVLAEQVRADAEAAGIVGTNETLRFFQQNEIHYQNLEITETTTRDTETVKKDVSSYKGRIFINGKKATKAQAIKQLAEFQNFVKTELDAKTFLIFLSYEIDPKGKINISIPPRELWADVAKEIEQSGIDKITRGQDGGVSEILDEYEINFVKS
jgi:hypothetical protein